uniref:Uncharacterized protein n=1 Tax=Oryza nivara TaxID=4536 RepID=A0A0E0J9X4_ORYNI
MPWQVTAAPLVVTDGSEKTPSGTLADTFHLSKADLEWFCVEVVAVLVVVITRANNAEGGGVRLGCGTGIDGDNVRGLAGDRPGASNSLDYCFDLLLPGVDHAVPLVESSIAASKGDKFAVDLTSMQPQS